MTATTIINLVGIIGVSVAVGWAWSRALRSRWVLEDELELLQGAISRSGYEQSLLRLVKRTRAYLAEKGAEQLERDERTLLMGLTRARAEAARAELSSRIELMPQIGLLGTVIGLTLSLAASPESVFDGLGLALVTTLIGLMGAALAKARLEPQADGLIQLIIALSNNAEVEERVRSVDIGALEDAA